MSNSNNNKTKNWLSRLMRIRRRSLDNLENSNDQEGPIVYRRGVSVYSGDSSIQQPRTLNSFRRSIIKMHTRMKNAFRHNNENSHITRHTLPTTNNSASPSHSQIRFLQEERIDPAPSVPPRRYYPQLSTDDQSSRVPKNEIANLSNFYWYWGPISRSQAEERLKSSPDGAFLVRDSTSDRYLFTMSFRSLGKILHTRIEFSKSGYSLFDQIGYNSVSELVEDAIVRSQNSVYCYTRYERDEVRPNFPVRLTLPVSRYDKVPTLKYLSRFIIRQSVIINDMDKLPLPVSLIAYLQEEGPYF